MNESAKAKHLADLDYFQTLLEKEPNSTYYLPVALIYSILERNDDVVRTCKTGLSKFPDFAQLKVLYAQGLINMGNIEEATNVLLDVIVADQWNYLALKLMGMIYMETGFRKEAIKYLQASYLMSPEDTQLLAWLTDMGALGLPAKQDIADEEAPEWKIANVQLIEERSDFIKTAMEVVEELSKDIATAKKAGKKPDDILLSPDSGLDLNLDENLHGNELSDDDIISALATSPPDEDLFDEDDGSFYDFSKGVKVITPEDLAVEQNMPSDLPVFEDLDDDDYDDVVGESFIPLDLVESVLSEAGIDKMEDIFVDDERITPDSLKGGKNAK